MRTPWAVGWLLVCMARVCRWLGIDLFFSVRVDAESDGGCSGRGGPSDRGVARCPRDCTSYVGRATPHALHVPAAPHCRSDLYQSLGPAFKSAIKSGKKANEMDRSEWWTTSDGRASEEVENAEHGLLFSGIK